MSDIDDELLELVEAGSDSKKRKKAKAKSSTHKRRKTDDSDSDNPETQEELYPLDGKYIDENDRERLMSLSMFEREAIIEKRLEEMDERNRSQKLSQFLAANQSDSVSNAAKRQHTARGATKEKDKKLIELRARRKAKADTKRSNGSPKRDRSSSPMDMETDEEEEEGQISKYEQEEEKDIHYNNESITLPDLHKCWLPRDFLVKHATTPWFEDLVKGAWVRYLIGHEDAGPVYRICEVIGLGPELVKPYKIENKTFDQALQLKHGVSVKIFPMDKVSNTRFDVKEFDRLKKTCDAEGVHLPSKQDLEKKKNHINKLSTQIMTESDVAAIIARKTQHLASKAAGLSALEKSRLKQARVLAERRQDYNEVAEIDAKLAEFTAADGAELDETRNGRREDDVLAKLSEKNRKANSEAVRKAELMEAERRRRERKLAMAGKSGTATPTDPSARLRTVPRTMLIPGSPSRSGTPNPATDSQQLPSEPDEKGTASALTAKLFEATVVNSIEVDLGDF